MATSHLQFCILSLLIFTISHSKAQTSTPKPKSLLLPVTKDSSTLQYLTQLNLGTPLTPKTVVLDLGGRHLWFDCEAGYNSSTYHPGHCGSAACSVAKPSFTCGICFADKPRPGCNKYTCSIALENTITRTVGYFEEGLTLGLPHQISSKFGGTLPRKFALCLSKSNGFVLFGDARYVFYSSHNKSNLIDVSKYFSFTKLYINPVPTADDVKGEPSAEYFIGVTSILVNKKPVRINTTLLAIDGKGYGGTKISTVNPYTVLESSIYNVVAETFGMELKAMNVAKVASVAPFSDCFSTEFLGYSRLGPSVPDMAFVFGNKSVYWELHGANLVVEISRDVVCLAVVDGGLNPRTSIVIGAHQLEDNLLQFDLAASKLGFTSTLLRQDVGCTNFKF
ncbi:hypothetical protein Acr_03g0018590 [Actinidia rufa]|uniref:Peptidase A1 domain-containing protein n=1 Tax=Actinidia rufa TaxID=165716 RepID=A0A7J0EF52_9ERIC|nr:hypothetical protein Acr_03g0018590 [Actinidia rufa]